MDRGSGKSQSVWMADLELPRFEPLSRNLEV